VKSIIKGVGAFSVIAALDELGPVVGELIRLGPDSTKAISELTGATPTKLRLVRDVLDVFRK